MNTYRTLIYKNMVVVQKKKWRYFWITIARFGNLSEASALLNNIRLIEVGKILI